MTPPRRCALLLAALLPSLALAQTPTTKPATSKPWSPTIAADSPTETPLWPVPAPVPFLSGQNELHTFKLAPGFHIQLVAQEPMVEHPVCMSFDADGRAWVVEMRSYMPDAAGTGENEPTGRISVLEDTDGDGVFDKSTVFLDHLVLPRAICPVQGGVLVGAPPNLIFCQDTTGGLHCDKQTVIAKDYGIAGNPEHMPNTPTVTLDNWIYSANYDKRIKYINHTWLFDPIPELGQWGLSQDDYGRLYHNNNIDQLRASILAPHYSARNPHYAGARGANEQVAHDQTVFPLHDTAVDRGYLTNIMRQDTGTLKAFTAACAPVIYRNGLFPQEFDQNAFVCEPAANLIKRDIVSETPTGALTARQAYKDTEFLSSTYERFRPVNITMGPDGGMYVVDMHHGLLQHKTYLTTYCKDQYLARELDKHLRTGRIFRIVPDAPPSPPGRGQGEGAPGLTSGVPFPRPHLSTATTAELIATLSHPNGWWRDTAQRLLVEKQNLKAITPLKKVAATSDNPLARLHALWTLDGFGTTGPSVVLPALSDKDPHIRAAAIRIAERMLHSRTPEPILSAVMKLKDDPSPIVRLQFAATMSSMGTPEVDATLASLLENDITNPLLRDAVLSGLPGRELDFLKLLLSTNVGSASADHPVAAPPPPAPEEPIAEAADNSPPQIHGVATKGPIFVPGGPPGPQPKSTPSALYSSFSRSVLASRNPKQVSALLALIATQPQTPNWRRNALLDGLVPPKNARRPVMPRPIVLPAEPTEFLALEKASQKAIAEKATTVLTFVHWPGQPGYVPPPPPPPLTPDEQILFDKGQQVFGATCAGCHKLTGLGQEGLAPPLVDSEWVLGPPDRVVRIALSGLQGPITVQGRTYSLDMPSLASMSDTDLAAAITYVRRSWEHTASPITPDLVHDIRTQEPRPVPWSERELLSLSDEEKAPKPRPRRRPPAK